jgi:hypothetical protein
MADCSVQLEPSKIGDRPRKWFAREGNQPGRDASDADVTLVDFELRAALGCVDLYLDPNLSDDACAFGEHFKH